MGEMGLFGLPFPEEYGGMGGDYFALCLTLEELARVDQSVAITLRRPSRWVPCRSIDTGAKSKSNAGSPSSPPENLWPPSV